MRKEEIEKELEEEEREKIKPEEESKEAEPGVKSETRLEDIIAEQIKIAIEKLGEENVFGPKEVEKTFGVRLKEVSAIPFSIEELERAEKLDQMLILRVDKTKDGKPMSLKAMDDILAKRWKKEMKGRLLNIVADWRDIETGRDAYYKNTPRSGWALVSKDLLPYSTNKNYIEQTVIIIKALQKKVFKDIEMSVEYVEAITEFNLQKERLIRLMSENWMEATKQLSELKINQLTRQSIQETIYDLAIYYDIHGKRLLPDRYTWSNSRSADDYLVDLGFFDSMGVLCLGWKPDQYSNNIGVSLSRRR